MSGSIGRRILLVEDEAIIAMTEKMELEKFGYSVRTVATGEKAVETVQSSSDIDLVLMDIDLGKGIDGTQAAEIILKTRDIPVVFLSSHTDPEIVEKTEKITSYGYVVKSSSITVLDASIKMALKLFDAVIKENAKEESLRQSEQKYKTLFNEMLDGFALHEIICNSAGVPVDYRFLDVNPVFERMTGLKAMDIVGHTVLEVMPGTEKYWIDTYGKVALSGEPVVFENYASALGKHFLVRAVRPAVNHFACVFEDITERKKAEQRLKASEELLAETESIGKVGGWSFNIDTLELKWTDEVYRIHEVEIVPSTNVDVGINFYTKESRPIIERAVQRAIEYGENYDLDLEIITAKGNTRAVHTIGMADLKNRRIYGFFQDITDRKQVEEELRRFKTISDHAIYGNAIADLQGNLIYVNRFFASIHGYEPRELIGKHFSIFHNEHQMNTVGNLIASLLREGFFAPTTVWHCHQDGTEFPMLMSGILIEDDYGNPQYLASSAVDITELKRADDALIEREALFRGMFKDHSAVMLLIDPGTGQIIKANQAASQFYGYSLEVLLQMKIQQLNILSPAEVAKEMGSALNRQFNIFNFRHKLADGQVRDVEVHSAPISIQHQTLLFSIVHDITERKQAEESLHKSEAIKNTMVSNISDVIVVIDKNGVNQYKSPNITKLFGWKPEELIGKNTWDTVHPDDLEACQNLFGTILHKPDATGSIELRYKRKDGRYVWIDITIRNLLHDKDIQGILGNYHDITDRKLAEASLTESVKSYHDLIALIPVGVYIFWVRVDGRLEFEYVSDRWCEMHRVSREDVLMDVGVANNLVHPDERDSFLACNQEAARDRKQFKWEGRFITGDGVLRHLRIESIPVVLENGDIRCFGVTHDITAQKKAEEEIKKQLSEKEILLREVHHRVKNNIANIKGLLSLQAGSTENAEVKAKLQEAISRVHSLQVLYEKLLLSEDLHEVSMKSFLEGLIESLVVAFDSGKTVLIEKQISDFKIDAKKAFYVGIIVNELLTNVFKYAFGNCDKGMVSVSIDKEAGKVTLIIKDDGCGFDERALEDSSTGFGRTIVKMLVEQLDGTYSSGNEDGARSVVRFGI